MIRLQPYTGLFNYDGYIGIARHILVSVTNLVDKRTLRRVVLPVIERRTFVEEKVRNTARRTRVPLLPDGCPYVLAIMSRFLPD
jgi:hypothetical protein